MRTAIAIVSVLILVGSARAEPFPRADPNAGRKLFEEAKCMACHAQRVGGDGSGLFTRPDRKVKSADALLKQIRACVTQLNVQWFPEDEAHVAAYLNQRYYKFP
jgi:cytochrome c2